MSDEALGNGPKKVFLCLWSFAIESYYRTYVAWNNNKHYANTS